MNEVTLKRDVGVSMRLREDDLDLIDRGAALNGLSRTEFMRRAALHEAQMALMNETLVRVSPDAFELFCIAIDRPVVPVPDKLRERLSRRPPWDAGSTQSTSS
jgi:uncharacterized protein (DUF1778 family)